MATPAVAWFEVTGKDGAALQRGGRFDWEVQDSGGDSGYGPSEIPEFAFFANPDRHVVGPSKGAVQ